MRTVAVSTELDAPADVVWTAVRTPEAFVHVTRGVLRFPVAAEHPRRWEVGDVVEGWTWLLGVVPFSRHRLEVAAIDDSAGTLDTVERGGLVRVWLHRITVTPAGPRCRYEDRIRIDAGVVTPVVVAFAHVFYRYRQRRWRRLAPVLAATAREPADQSG